MWIGVVLVISYVYLAFFLSVFVWWCRWALGGSLARPWAVWFFFVVLLVSCSVSCLILPSNIKSGTLVTQFNCLHHVAIRVQWCMCLCVSCALGRTRYSRDTLWVCVYVLLLTATRPLDHGPMRRARAHRVFVPIRASVR